MPRIRTPPVRYSNISPPSPPQPIQYLVPPRTVDFIYGDHNSRSFQHRIFGSSSQADMPALLIEDSEIPNAGYVVKVVHNTVQGSVPQAGERTSG